MQNERVRLDLNNASFQKALFALSKPEQLGVLGTLRKLSEMSWDQVYKDPGLKWELIYSKTGPNGKRLYSFRIGKGFRAVALREGEWMRILSLHPDHDSAYRR
ncbi:MAG: hypothetical protein K6T83_17855 [Alicyclobacillus sp.]|nr:hypothetical protein [Alicyclobacillus sp.]